MKRDIKLFSLISFDIMPINDKPIIFDYGDSINFKIKTLISPSPSGLIELAKQVQADGVKTSSYRIFSTVSYVDGKNSIRLEAFYSPIPKQKENTIGIFEILNNFNIETSKLLNVVNQSNGYLEFKQQWSDEKNPQYSGDIVKVCLPVYGRNR